MMSNAEMRAREELDLLEARRKFVPIWRPNAGRQTMAAESDADIIFYGGAAGGGKTDWIIGKALTQHRQCMIVRKNGTEHYSSLNRLIELTGSRDGWRSKDAVWAYQNPIKQAEVQIEFGSVPNAGDEQKYRGRPHDLLAFDEVTEIPEHVFRFLTAWNRTTVPGQRCQIIASFNPPSTVEGRWVIEFLAPWLDPTHPNPAKLGELRWFATLAGKDIEVPNANPITTGEMDPATGDPEVVYPKSRTFIASRVTDNPFLMRDKAYMATLQGLPEPLRSQMLYGDFSAGLTDSAWATFPSAWVKAAMDRWVEPAKKPPMDAVGVDVARGGKDQTFISRRHGMWFDKLVGEPGANTPSGSKSAGLVMANVRDDARVFVDVIGVGASTVDFLADWGAQVFGINVANKSTATSKNGRLGFFNLRSQLMWKLRELLDPDNNTGIALPPDRELAREMASVEWEMAGRVIRCADRDKIIDVLGHSPDRLTAVMLAQCHAANMKAVASETGYGDRDPGPQREYHPHRDL